MCKGSCEVVVELHFQRLVLVVLCTLVSTAVETLATVEQMRSLIPCIAHLVDVEAMTEVIFLHHDAASVGRLTDRCVAYAHLVEQVLNSLNVAVGNLNHHSRILCEQGLHDVITAECTEVDVKTAILVSKGHFEQCGNHTASADVVTCHYQSLLYHVLQSIECIAEILRVLHHRNVIAHLASCLCKGATAKTLLVEREVDMEESCALVVHQYRRNHFLHV